MTTQSIFRKRALSISKPVSIVFVITLVGLLTGCVVAKAVETTADIAIGTTKGVVKAGAAAIDLAIPDDDEESLEEESSSDTD